MNTSGGAEAYMVMASDNEISYNSAVNCWGENQTLGGAEGGCLEIVNGQALATIENVRFHHNYCERSVGLFEGCSGNFQGTDAIQENHGIIRDSVIAYNISVDAMWLYLLQPVNTDFYNLVFEHNTLVHTPANEDIPQGGASSFGLLVNDDQGYSADPLQPGMVIVRNNLFFTTGGGTGMMTLVPDHYNNLFAPSAPMSWTLGTGEIEVADPGLTADYRLAAGSPAIDVGSPEAWQQWTDFDGNAVPLGNGRDIGASEYCDGANCAEPVDLGTGGSSSTGSGGTDSGPTCEGSLTLCGDTCVDTSSDGAHCGGCNNACPASQVCSAGACVSGGCPEGQTECNQGCVDTSTDVLHCGACNASCRVGQTCVGGVCTGTPTGGDLTDPTGGGDESEEESGCGCTVPTASRSLPGAALGVLLGLLAFGRRRRHRA
jgi:MYXO-CTERM domain-containing protein